MADTNPYQEALEAGYSPDQILSHVTSSDQTLAGKVAAARKAGYDSAEIVGHLNDGANPPDKSYTSALLSGVAAPLRGIGTTLQATGLAPGIGQSLQGTADAIQPQNYESASDKVAEHPWDNLSYLPRAAVEQVGNLGGDLLARGAGSAVGGVLGSMVGPEGTAGGAAAGAFAGPAAFQTMQQLGPIALARAKNEGRDTPNKEDWLAAGAAAGLNGAAMGAIGKFLPGASSLASGAEKAVAGTAASLGTGFTGGLATQAAEDAPLDPKAALGQAMVGATAGGGMALGNTLARTGAANVMGALRGSGVSDNVKAYQQEVQPWNQALQQATQQAQQANPQAAPEDIQNQAYTALSGKWSQALDAARQQVSQQSPDTAPEQLDQVATQLAKQQGAIPPPSFSNLSPQGQNGIAEISAIQMYDAARKSATEGMGRTDDGSIAPNVIFKNMRDGITDNLGKMSDLLKSTGLIDKEQAGDLNAAISQGARHNRAGEENGGDFGWFDTLRDRVSDLPIDPAMRDQVLQQLRVLDIASNAGLAKNSKGPLERNAGIIMPALGAGAAAMFGGGAGMGMLEGGMGGALMKGLGTQGLRKIDSLMGNGIPDILQRRQAIEDFAQKNGLQGVADPMRLQQMQDQLRGLAQTQPLGPILQAQAQAAAQGRQGPVTSPGRPYDPASAPQPQPQAAPMAPPLTVARTPISPPQQPPPGPTPVPGPAPAQAPQRPVVAPVAPAQAATGPAAMQATMGALQARNQRLRDAIQATNPNVTRGWEASMADNLGVRASDVQAVMGQLAQDPNTHPDVAAILQARPNRVPEPLLPLLYHAVRQARDNGDIPSNAQAAGGASSGVRNPLSYAHNLRQEAEAAAGITAARPDLQGAVNDIRDPNQNGKTALGRAKVLEGILARIKDPKERATVEAILRPLTGFGQK